MCDPLSLAVATFTVGAAKSTMSFIGASQQASAQEALYDANKASANYSSNYEHAQLARRRIQEQDAAGEKMFDNALETRAKAASAEAAALDSGISGLSVDSLIRDVIGSGGRTNDRLQHNLDMTLDQLH